jgi:hypothetical protein
MPYDLNTSISILKNKKLLNNLSLKPRKLKSLKPLISLNSEPLISKNHEALIPKVLFFFFLNPETKKSRNFETSSPRNLKTLLT